MAVLGSHCVNTSRTNASTATAGLPPQPAQRRRLGTWAWFAVAFVLIAVAMEAAQAQSFNVIYSFSDQRDGADPYSGLSIDRNGTLYGTAFTGGGTGCNGQGCGTVFKLKRSGSTWIMTPLYAFAGGNDGAQPRARVVIGRDGALYGTTFLGGGTGCGGAGCGTVFVLRPSPFACGNVMCNWKETVLYRFTGDTDGGQPLGDLAFDQAGNIYGTTQEGGKLQGCGGLGCGVVYKLTKSGGTWTESVLHQFQGGTDGLTPNGGVIFDQSGNLYGVTLSGGSGGFGTVFQLTPSGSGWINNVIYNFQNILDGSEPDSGLMFDASGNLYGSTIFGGTGLGGTVFELTPSGSSWNFSIVCGLTGIAGPFANLSMDAAGNMYGTTWQDGIYTAGSVFQLTPGLGGWTYNSIHDFTGGGDGYLPISNLVFDSRGNMYGTASYGGANGYGVVLEVTP